MAKLGGLYYEGARGGLRFSFDCVFWWYGARNRVDRWINVIQEERRISMTRESV